MRCLSLLLLCLLVTLTQTASSDPAPGNRKRDYANRFYYTLYTPAADAEAAKAVAEQLGARFEGQVGGLNRYYWISIPRTSSAVEKRDEDSLIDRFHQIKSRALDKRTLSVFDRVERIDKQVPRRKLHKRAAIVTRQVEDDDIPEPPVVENVDEENKANHRVISAGSYLDEPGGFSALKEALGIQDPGFDHQWHLVNYQQRGHDVNVTGVWSQGITGKNVVVAILDDGLDMESEDLKDNFFAPGSYDFNARTELPKPRLADDNHGTRCAGEIAAAKNNVCGVGVAYDAKVAGIRILSEDITDADEAEALNYGYQDNHIYSCSWGPPDLGEVAEAPQGIVLDALKNGIANGRNGSGTIYVFASGNGGSNDDNCNYDGYTNSLYTITVGAIDRRDNHPYYAEKCSAQLVVTYSSGSGGHIYTTDVGQRQCTDHHGGTSAAAPLAAGIFALVLSVRPDLSWRDMQYLCVETAIPISLEDTDWATLPSGRMYSNKFGYGKLDAYAIVEHAKTFKNVRPQTYLQLPSPSSNEQEIPDLTELTGNVDKSRALTSTITVTEDMVKAAGLGRLEHVTATVNIEHGRRGDLETLLESPNEVISQLGAPRKFDTSAEGLINWTFMSVKHWGENPVGNWTLRIVDGKNPQYTGKFINWTLTLWGEIVENFQGEPVHVPKVSDETDESEIGVSEGSITGEPDPLEHNEEDDNEPVPDGTDISFADETSSALDSDPTATKDVPELEETSSPDDAQIPPHRPVIIYDDGSSIRDDHRSFFAYTVVTLLIVCGLIATVFFIRRRYVGAKSASQTTAYTPVNRHDVDQYEFDVLRSNRKSDAVPEDDMQRMR